MRSKPVIPRVLAVSDVDEALDFYLGNGGEAVALRFIDALERAYSHIDRQPASGSSRYAHELDIERVWSARTARPLTTAG